MDARWLALIVLTAARTSLGFQFQSLASVSPFLVRDLAIGYAEVGFLIGLYMMPGVVLAIPGGVLGQRFGDKRVVLIGLVLMTLGAVMAGLAESYPMLLAGRLVSGIGGVLLNVVMSKMIIDWFAGREIVLAMAIFINSFPIGLGLALLSLGWLAESAGWQAAFHATAGAAAASLALVALFYRRHPNDRRASQTGVPNASISRDEVTLVCLAGAMWGAFNGALAVMLGFTPNFLVASGMTAAQAGFIVGLMTSLAVASIQAGGVIAQRWGRPNTLMLIGVVVWGVCMLLLPATKAAPVLVIIGLFSGLSVGVLVSLPSEVLRPENRSTGMGLFFTGLYVGFAVLPPIAGWLQDLSGNAAMPLYFAGMLILSIVPMLAAFRLLQNRLLGPSPIRPS